MVMDPRPEPDHKGLEGSAATKEAFAFLEARGFRVARVDRDDRRRLDCVVYESPEAYVGVRFDEYRCFSVHLGELPPSMRGQPLESHLLRSFGKAPHISFHAFCFDPKTADATRRAAGRTAEELLQYCGDLIGPGSLDIDALKAAQDRMRQDRDQRETDDKRQQAARAFEHENWEQAYRLYRGIRQELNPDEISRFELARSLTPPPLVRRDEDDREWWLSRARLLEATRRAVNESAKRRDESPDAYRRWTQAVESFHDAWHFMYPFEFLEQVRRLRGAATKQVDDAITFLEADPWCFRSGYVKEDILRRLQGVPLAKEHEDRLRKVMVHAVDVGNRREFKWHCRLARRLDNPELRQALLERLASTDPGVRRRAFWMVDGLPLQLSPGHRHSVGQVIIDAGFDQDWWRVAGWVRAAVRKYEDDVLEERVLSAFREKDPVTSDAALRILALLKTTRLTPNELQQLRARLVRAMDTDDSKGFESLARVAGLRSQDLVDQLSDRMQSDDRAVATRARWALGSLRE